MYQTIEITLPYSPVGIVFFGSLGVFVIWKVVKAIINSIPFI